MAGVLEWLQAVRLYRSSPPAQTHTLPSQRGAGKALGLPWYQPPSSRSWSSSAGGGCVRLGERSNALTVFRAAGGGCTSLDDGLLPQRCCCCNENCKIKLIYETLPFPSCPPYVLIFVVSEVSGMLGRLTTGIPPPHHTASAQLLPISSGLARVLLVGLL